MHVDDFCTVKLSTPWKRLGQRKEDLWPSLSIDRRWLPGFVKQKVANVVKIDTITSFKALVLVKEFSKIIDEGGNIIWGHFR
jgi:hypothetical protein